MIELSKEIAAFHAQRLSILRDMGPCWVAVFGDVVETTSQSFEEAASVALARHPNEPFLIRHVDEGTPHVPLVVIEAA